MIVMPNLEEEAYSKLWFAMMSWGHHGLKHRRCSFFIYENVNVFSPDYNHKHRTGLLYNIYAEVFVSLFGACDL